MDLLVSGQFARESENTHFFFGIFSTGRPGHLAHNKQTRSLTTIYKTYSPWTSTIQEVDRSTASA